MNSMVNISNFPVMKKRCATCPFGESGKKDNCKEIANVVRMRAFEGSQICHHPRLHGKKETHLCRGSRNYQIEIMHRLGVISEPNDEAWDEAVKNAAKRRR